MNASDTTITRRIPFHPGFALIETVIELVMTGWRTLSGWAALYAAARKRGHARRELHQLSDRSLRDIGLERDQIDRLFL